MHITNPGSGHPATACRSLIALMWYWIDHLYIFSGWCNILQGVQLSQGGAKLSMGYSLQDPAMF